MQKANLNLFTGTFQFPFNLPGESCCESYAEIVCICESVCVIFFLPVFFFFNADLRYFIMKLLWSPKTTTNELF